MSEIIAFKPVKASSFEKAAWYKRCRSKFSRSIGPLWPLLTALHAPGIVQA
jgi:hypothetical protein